MTADQSGMRCLHCGRELALLKRLTGGEFCSDEHRLQYQRDYSQLALSRLLQAKPPLEGESSEGVRADGTPVEAGASVETPSAPASIPRSIPPGSPPPVRRRLQGNDGERTSAPNQIPHQERPALRGAPPRELTASPTGAPRPRAPQVAGRTPAALPQPSLQPAGSNLPATMGRFNGAPSRPAPTPGSRTPGTLPPSRTPAALPAGQTPASDHAQSLQEPVQAKLGAPRRTPAAFPAPDSMQPAEVDAAQELAQQPGRNTATKRLEAPQTGVRRPGQEVKEVTAPAPMSLVVKQPAGAPKKIDFTLTETVAEPLAISLQPAPPFTRFAPRIAGLSRAHKNASDLVRQVEEIASRTVWQPNVRVFRTEFLDFTPLTQLIQLNTSIASAGRPKPAETRVEVPVTVCKPQSSAERFWQAAAVAHSSGLVELGGVTRLNFSTAELDADGVGEYTDAAAHVKEPRAKNVRVESQRHEETELSDDQLARKPRTGVDENLAGIEPSNVGASPSQLEDQPELSSLEFALESTSIDVEQSHLDQNNLDKVNLDQDQRSLEKSEEPAQQLNAFAASIELTFPEAGEAVSPVPEAVGTELTEGEAGASDGTSTTETSPIGNDDSELPALSVPEAASSGLASSDATISDSNTTLVSEPPFSADLIPMNGMQKAPTLEPSASVFDALADLLANLSDVQAPQPVIPESVTPEPTWPALALTPDLPEALHGNESPTSAQVEASAPPEPASSEPASSVPASSVPTNDETQAVIASEADAAGSLNEIAYGNTDKDADDSADDDGDTNSDNDTEDAATAASGSETQTSARLSKAERRRRKAEKLKAKQQRPVQTTAPIVSMPAANADKPVTPAPVAKPNIAALEKAAPVQATAKQDAPQKAAEASKSEAPKNTADATRNTTKDSRSLPKPISAPGTSVELTAGREKSPMIWIAAGIALLGLLGGGLYLYTDTEKEPERVVAPLPLPWRNIDAGKRRQITLPPMVGTSADYTVEMESKLAEKPIGWAFRVGGPQNFYVQKLAIRGQGFRSLVSVHYLVQNGAEIARAETPINLPSEKDSAKLWRIRFEANGDHFTTWVDGKKIDDWRDPRLKTGTSGIYQDETTNALSQEHFHVFPVTAKQ